MIDISSRLNEYVRIFEDFIYSEVSADKFSGRESDGFSLMLEAMNYSLKNGGKRIRPVLVMEFCRLCGGKIEDCLHYAASLEMIHTYSLIHDDLPCMDDDDYRRGKLSNHKVYGYANALLAGDGLLTLAFEEISKSSLSDSNKMKAVKLLSESAGASGMIAGQVMDLANENKSVDLETLKTTDLLKTGKLISSACVLGCIAAEADDKYYESALSYGKNIGLAFQIIDDILDVTGDESVLGKPIGSDADNNKSTYVSILGLDKAKRYAEILTEDAIKSLNVFGKESDFLNEFATKLVQRKN